jgi:hypothetical protein
MTAYWIAVASAEHVRRGRDEGFMQVSHGKAAPLKRIKPGDRVVYYSPAVTFGGKDGLQSFTAIGKVKDREPYVFDMGKGSKPFRRDVTWRSVRCSMRWNSPPANRTGVISSGSDFFDQRSGFSFDRKSDARGRRLERNRLRLNRLAL